MISVCIYNMSSAKNLNLYIITWSLWFILANNNYVPRNPIFLLLIRASITTFKVLQLKLLLHYFIVVVYITVKYDIAVVIS